MRGSAALLREHVGSPEDTGADLVPDPVSETIYLIGRSTPERFLRFVRREGVDSIPESVLIDEWRRARERIRALRKEEGGIADGAEVGELGPEYEPLLIEFLRDPLVRHGFNLVPTEVGMVELDRLVVYQNHIDLAHVDRIVARIGSSPGREDVFRACLPFDHPAPPVAWSRMSDNRYVFMSPSNDLRFLGTLPLEGNQVVNVPPPGSVVGIVGVTVGFGSNFLNAVKIEHRLILNNGSHRAFALRQLGVTHVPCVVQHLASRAELGAVGLRRVQEHPSRFLKDPRPSLLKDYFDSSLRKTVRVRRRMRQVTVRFEVDEAYVPIL